MIESSVDNTKGSTSMPLNSNVSKEYMLMSILVYSHAIMPYPGALGTTFFKCSISLTRIAKCVPIIELTNKKR